MRHWFSDLSAFQRDPLGFLLGRGCTASTPLLPLAMGFSPVYLVTDATLIKPIMKAAEADIDKGRLIYKLREIIGQSSMTISGERHRERRAAIHKQLARGLATNYVPQICAAIRRHASALVMDGEFDAHRATAPLALRLVSIVLFGPAALTQADENALVEAVHMVEDDLAADIFKVLPDLPWVRRRKKRKLRQGREIMALVVERARRRASESSLLKALEDLKLTEEELRDEILLLFLAGHHTSGTAAAWLLYHLAVDPDLRRAVAREASSITDRSGEIIAEKLPGASLSLALAREILRLYPSAYWLSREVQGPFELAGMKLKKGTSLVISPWHMHRDPRYWSNPEAFDLRRSHKSPAYMPFGAGPRACVGMGLGMLELQLIALEFASAFDLEIMSAVPPPAPKASVTLVPPAIRIAARLRYADASSVAA